MPTSLISALFALPSAPLAALPDGQHDVLSIALAILGIGFLIFVHELGHFLACRITKTRVETFSIGFGPRLFGWETIDGVRRFTTGARRGSPAGGALDIRIAAIPLGGYVKMAGEIGGDGSATSGAGGAPRAPAPDEYPAKSFGARTLIISAGVIMNALFAFLFFWIAYGSGVREIPPVVGDVEPGGAAWVAGLEGGDTIEAIDGRKARTFLDVAQGVALTGKGASAAFDVVRDGARRTIPVAPAFDEKLGLQQAQIRPIAVLTIDDGTGAKVVVGARELAVVSGHRVRGGARVLAQIEAARSAGRESFDLMLPERDPVVSRTISLARARKAPAKPVAWKLGVTFTDRRRVLAVREESAAARSGLLAGDVVVAVDGQDLLHPADLGARSSLSGLEVLREGRRVPIQPRADGFTAVAAWLEDVAFATAPLPGPVTLYPSGGELPDRRSPAADAGVLPGDVLVAMNGLGMGSVEEVLSKAKSFDGSPVRLTVRTGDASPREVTFQPRPEADRDELAAFLGLETPKELVEVGGVGGAAAVALDRTKTEIGNIFRLIGRFFSGAVSFRKNISGPLTIANLSSRTAKGGLAEFLAFLAFISVNLCVLNFLPIPVLDGGQMMFLLIEKARGRPLSEAAIARFQMVGLLLLLVLMGFALSNDVTNLFGS